MGQHFNALALMCKSLDSYLTEVIGRRLGGVVMPEHANLYKQLQ